RPLRFDWHLSVDEAAARRLLQCGRERVIFLAAGTGELRDLGEMELRLLAIALLDLPQAVILPGLDVVGIGLQRALVPDLRELVVAELAIGIADQGGDRRVVVATHRLELVDRRGIIVTLVDRIIGGAIGRRRRRLLQAGLPALLPLGRGIDRR